ncbi:basic salivary proline-rich protein 4-like [Vidua macroura]|uniref:basic salivary proline-rich protein 4-like n=1 Tax=Vidua macroura TaxID=187451 RepID=UPI0023A82093|nr:basic salivary proline-rich protein 4-like [Vidua macroura]
MKAEYSLLNTNNTQEKERSGMRTQHRVRARAASLACERAAEPTAATALGPECATAHLPRAPRCSGHRPCPAPGTPAGPGPAPRGIARAGVGTPGRPGGDPACRGETWLALGRSRRPRQCVGGRSRRSAPRGSPQPPHTVAALRPPQMGPARRVPAITPEGRGPPQRSPPRGRRSPRGAGGAAPATGAN